MDRLVTGYLNKQQRASSQKKNSDGLTADDYYRRLLGGNKAPSKDSAMGTKSAALSKAYAVAVKQYHMMRTENLSEKDALDKVSRDNMEISRVGVLSLTICRFGSVRSRNCWHRRTTMRKPVVVVRQRLCKRQTLRM